MKTNTIRNIMMSSSVHLCDTWSCHILYQLSMTLMQSYEGMYW